MVIFILVLITEIVLLTAWFTLTPIGYSFIYLILAGAGTTALSPLLVYTYIACVSKRTVREVFNRKRYIVLVSLNFYSLSGSIALLLAENIYWNIPYAVLLALFTLILWFYEKKEWERARRKTTLSERRLLSGTP